MSSGGGKTQTTVQNSGPPSWAEPYFKQMLTRANTVTNQPYIGYDGPRIADFTDDQLAGFDMVRQQAGQDNPLMQAASNFATGAVNGANEFHTQGNQYLGGTTPVQGNPYAGQNNPYLGQMINDAQSDVTRAYSNITAPNMMAQFNAGGAYGGSAHQQALAESQRQVADQLGQISTSLRGADYQNQQQLAENDINRRMAASQADLARNAGLYESQLDRQQNAWRDNQALRMNALSAVPSLQSSRYDDARALMNIGQQQQSLYQGLYDQGYEDFRDWRDYDTNQLGILANALGSVQGGTGSQTGANPNYRSAGQNAAGYAALIASLWG